MVLAFSLDISSHPSAFHFCNAYPCLQNFRKWPLDGISPIRTSASLIQGDIHPRRILLCHYDQYCHHHLLTQTPLITFALSRMASVLGSSFRPSTYMGNGLLDPISLQQQQQQQLQVFFFLRFHKYFLSFYLYKYIILLFLHTWLILFSKVNHILLTFIVVCYIYLIYN